MEIEVGNKVKFINEDLKGEIIKVLPEGKVYVSCSDGFEYTVDLCELIIINADNEHSYKTNQQAINKKVSIDSSIKANNRGVLSKYIELNKFKYQSVLEIDLHLEELVEFPQKLDDWHKLHTQMTHVKNCLTAALDKNIKKIVFIHGVGTGVLKTELQNYLSNYDYITTQDADFREYGKGATEVIIK